MDKAAIREQWNLWLTLFLMKGPMIIWALTFMFFDIPASANRPNLLLIMGPSVVLGVLIMCMPIFWKGSLSYREMVKRISRKSDGISIVLAILPIVLLLVSQVLFNLHMGNKIGIQLPSFQYDSTEARTMSLAAIFVSVPSGLVALLIFANASDYADRVKFVLLAAGIPIFVQVIQFVSFTISTKELPSGQLLQMISPILTIVLEAGKAIVLIGLLHRGRSSIKAFTVFLGAFFLVQFFMYLTRAESVAMGLIGGGTFIWIVNYFQHNRERRALQIES